VSGFKPDWAERIQRGRTKAFAKGYHKGSNDMEKYLRQLLIKEIINDAVLSTNADVDMIERVVEIIEGN
jgi:flagellar biosynthesis/type III secretory pathway protein FliH